MEHTAERVDHAKGVKITPQGRFLINCLCGWHSPDVLLIESRDRADAIYHEHVEDNELAAQYERNASRTTDKPPTLAELAVDQWEGRKTSRTADSAPYAQCTICRQPNCAHPKNIWA
jgi:hypothetical protein